MRTTTSVKFHLDAIVQPMEGSENLHGLDDAA